MPDRELIADQARLGRNSTTSQLGFRHGKLIIWVEDVSNPANVALGQAEDSINGPNTIHFKCRGTVENPTEPQVDDHIFGKVGYAFSGGTWFDCGTIFHLVDDAVVAGQRPGSRWEFHCNAPNAAPAPRMKIFGNGTVYVGDAGLAVDRNRKVHIRQSSGFTPFLIQNENGGSSANCIYLIGGDNVTTGSKFAAMERPDGTEIGTIRQDSATTVAYNTSSDERMKSDIADMPVGLALANQIRPREFRYRNDSTGRRMTGFLAQELYTVFPDAVTPAGPSRECDCDLSKGPHAEDCVYRNPWGVDYGRLTPLLVKAVQELDAKITAMGG